MVRFRSSPVVRAVVVLAATILLLIVSAIVLPPRGGNAPPHDGGGAPHTSQRCLLRAGRDQVRQSRREVGVSQREKTKIDVCKENL